MACLCQPIKKKKEEDEEEEDLVLFALWIII